MIAAAILIASGRRRPAAGRLPAACGGCIWIEPLAPPEADEADHADPHPRSPDARIEAIRLKVGPAMNPGGVADKVVPRMCLVPPPAAGPRRTISVEHPSGEFTVELEAEGRADSLEVGRAALPRTARRLFEGNVLIPREIWDGTSGLRRTEAPA